jgi:hypothetical protein
MERVNGLVSTYWCQVVSAPENTRHHSRCMVGTGLKTVGELQRRSPRSVMACFLQWTVERTGAIWEKETR